MFGLSLTLFTWISVFHAWNVSARQDLTDEAIRQYGNDLKSWLVDTKGGFMSDSLEIRRRDPNDPTSPAGIFASQTIPSGEMILQIPRMAYLSVPLDQIEPTSEYLAPTNGESVPEEEDKDEWKQDINYKAYLDEEMKDYHNKTCMLSQELLKETRLYYESPNSSAYAPYIRYLEETQPTGQIPATYSFRGKKLLRKIQGIHIGDNHGENITSRIVSEYFGLSPLPPEDLVDWIDTQFVQEGCMEADDHEAYRAVALVVQRGFDLECIPLWDMHNHDVRERLNVETNSLRSPEGLIVTSTKTVHAGEEILYTYNYCADCFDMGDLWGTPGMYRDFGFLEGYPQYWPFLDQKVYATIDQLSNGILQARFETYSEVNVESLAFFGTQLARLETIDIESEIQSLTSSFWRFT